MGGVEEFQDWEMLQSTSPSFLDLSLRPDYFALDLNSKGRVSSVDFDSISSDLLSDSGSEVVVSPKIVDFEGKLELGYGEYSSQVEFEGIEVQSKDDGLVSEEIRGFGGNHEMGCEDNLIDDVGFQGISEIQEFDVNNNEDSGEVLLDSRGGGEVLLDSRGGVSELENSGGELVCANFEQIGDGEIVDRSETSGVEDVIEGGGALNELKSVEEEKRIVVWWKFPFELLKFCAFRVSPVWSVSIAAAVMGLVILRRRMSRMKRKSRSIPIKLTVEDKKVSQFMMRAARLNEAFSVVKRVPIIRPLLPAAGVTPWPVLNLR